MSGLILIIIILGIFSFWLEISHRLNPFSPLKLKGYDWKFSNTNFGLEVTGWIEINNPHPRMEVMVPEFDIKPKVLGKEGVKTLKIKTFIATAHPDEESRKDGYWTAYIVKSKKKTNVHVTIKLENNDSVQARAVVENILADIYWVNYGPFGRINRRQGIVFPIKYPIPLSSEKAYFKQYKDCQLLPIKTHLLGPLDNILNVVNNYAANIVNPGDILTIGETPMAVIQGRYHHPSEVKPKLLSRILCRAFHPTSSLATACGLQTLIDIVGPSRVFVSLLLGFTGKLVGIKGVFYRVAGEQARLIDDITGTTPPYDQMIVLGPKSPQEICEKVSSQIGIEVAIVDVNDLGRVKILAASKNCNKRFLRKALFTNPAGNANEQTPLVLVRPYIK